MVQHVLGSKLKGVHLEKANVKGALFVQTSGLTPQQLADLKKRGAKVLSGSLFDAIKAGNVELVKKLISEGASLAQRDGDGNTPLIVAVLANKPQLVNLLTAQGAPVDDKGVDGASALFVAAYKGHQKIVRVLLAKKATVNAKTKEGATPLACCEQIWEQRNC